MIKYLIAILVTVVSIHDADTCRMSDGTKVRFAEIDAPELKQPYGPEATEFLKSQILNKQVDLEVKGKDFYHRTLGLIYLNNTEINKLLVEKGYAWSYNSKRLKPLMLEAKSNHLGLWADENPIEPRKYRKQEKLKLRLLKHDTQ